MKKENLKTPAILLNMNALKNNIKVYQEMCNKNNKELVTEWDVFYGCEYNEGKKGIKGDK